VTKNLLQSPQRTIPASFLSMPALMQPDEISAKEKLFPTRVEKYFFSLEWWGERSQELLQVGKPVMMRRMTDYIFTEPHLRHWDTHLSSWRERQMQTSNFFLLCWWRTGLLALRNTAAKALGDRVRGAAYYSTEKQEALIKLAFRLMVLDSLGISQALSGSCCLPKICRRGDEGGKENTVWKQDKESV